MAPAMIRRELTKPYPYLTKSILPELLSVTSLAKRYPQTLASLGNLVSLASMKDQLFAASQTSAPKVVTNMETPFKSMARSLERPLKSMLRSKSTSTFDDLISNQAKNRDGPQHRNKREINEPTKRFAYRKPLLQKTKPSILPSLLIGLSPIGMDRSKFPQLEIETPPKASTSLAPNYVSSDHGDGCICKLQLENIARQIPEPLFEEFASLHLRCLIASAKKRYVGADGKIVDWKTNEVKEDLIFF